MAKQSVNDKFKLNVILLGGTGINIGKELIDNAKTSVLREAQFIALDSSDANDPEGKFVVERMKKPGTNEYTRGSGGIRGSLYELADPFVNEVLPKYDIKGFIVIVCSATGGTGSVLAAATLRWANSQNIPVIIVPVTNFTSIGETINAINTLQGWSNQTAKKFLDRPVIYAEVRQEDNLTRRQVNDDAIMKVNLISLFLNENNDGLDYNDLRNIMTYNRVHNVPASLSRIQFFDQTTVMEYDGKPPVAVASLFANRDEIANRFRGTVARKEGVFNDKPNDRGETDHPGNMTELHMALDHGEAINELIALKEELEQRKDEVKQTFRTQPEIDSDCEDNGDVI